jgi:hypothetical protein
MTAPAAAGGLCVRHDHRAFQPRLLRGVVRRTDDRQMIDRRGEPSETRARAVERLDQIRCVRSQS